MGTKRRSARGKQLVSVGNGCGRRILVLLDDTIGQRARKRNRADGGCRRSYPRTLGGLRHMVAKKRRARGALALLAGVVGRW